MVKRYCDICGQQIDEGVHAWYVFELHGTDGEFRHKEFCEECYEYLCKEDEVPTADRKTEPQIEAPYIDIETGILHWCGWKYRRIYEDEPQTMVYPQVDGVTPSVIVKTESQTDCSWK